MKHLIKKAEFFLEEALPYMQKFKGKTVVIKYGGKAMQSSRLKESVMEDVALLWFLGLKPVLVHGGGPEISREMEKAKIVPRFVRGLRVTDRATMKITSRVFKRTNAEIRQLLSLHCAEAVDSTGCLYCVPLDRKLGLVGKVVKVDAEKILLVQESGKIPVISPLGRGIGKNGGKKYNINADLAATAVAKALRAEKLTMLTDVHGVIVNGKFVPHLSKAQARSYIRDGTIHGGMIPKVESCISVLESGCSKAHLISGTIPHSLLFEIFTDKGVGTEFVRNRK